MLNSLIIGCGDIGKRVGRLLQQRDHTVTALVRSQKSAMQLASSNFTTLISDLDNTSVSLPSLDADTHIFYFAPPSDEGDHDLRMQHFLQALTHSETQPTRIIYISTTAVYGDSRGAWIDEQTPTQPGNPRGRRRLDAENQLITYQQQRSVAVTILRVPGIYSANRLPFQQIKEGRPILKQAIAPFSNRIHANDLSEICVSAATCHQPSCVIYNVSDGNPGSISQYFHEVALAFSLPPPPEIDWPAAEQQLSPGMLSYLRESKRIDGRLVIKSLGITLRYPTLEMGLRQCQEELSGPDD